MKVEARGYKPLPGELTGYQAVVVDFVDFQGINFYDPSTYIEDGTYKTIGIFPSSLPTPPFRNYRTHHLSNFWIIEGNYAVLKNHFDKEFDEGDFWLRAAGRILEVAKGTDNYDDYTGGNDEGKSRYLKEDAAFMRDLARPTGMICFVYQFCRTRIAFPVNLLHLK